MTQTETMTVTEGLRGFAAALDADPQNWALRLVYADALEAAEGVVVCCDCDGTGDETSDGQGTCGTCRGSGRVSNGMAYRARVQRWMAREEAAPRPGNACVIEVEAKGNVCWEWWYAPERGPEDLEKELFEALPQPPGVKLRSHTASWAGERPYREYPTRESAEWGLGEALRRTGVLG